MIEEINPNAAAVDVGSETMHCSIAGGPVQVFNAVTCGLYALRDWLLAERVTTVAMEATGVYWLPLYEVLEAARLKVCVVNGAHVKNLPGRKSDVADCQWHAKLHAHGLLRGGFVPPGDVRTLRDYQRLREDHLGLAASHIQHMQKALDRMNLKIHDVLSDLCGESGMAMVRAILEGEREPEKLAELCAKSVLKKKRQRLLEALEGTWKEEHLFALRQALEGWEFYQRQMQNCDEKIATVLKTMSAAANESKSGGSDDAPRKRSGKNAPKIEGMSQDLKRIFGGADPGRLPGLSDYTAMQLLGEVGADMSAWKSAKHFTSWLGLSPGKRQSGKSHRNQSRKGGRAGKIFRIVARSIGRSVNTALGAFYRRIKGARGGLVASKATGRKIAVLFYNLLTKGGQYVENGLAAYEKTYREQAAHRIAKTARKFGLKVTASTPLHSKPDVHW